MNKSIYLAITLIIAMIAAPVSAEQIEIRSEVADGDIMYNYMNAAFLWMDLDKNISSEVITITTSGIGNRTIADGALTYVCVPKSQTYKKALTDTYEIIGFLGSKYVVYDKSNELVRLLEKWDDNDEKMLYIGDSYLMPEGYELKMREIDLDGNKVVIEFLKDGIELDTEIVINGNTYIYEVDDVMVFSVEISSVFRGTDSNACEIGYIWLISQDVMEVESGDNFGELEVTGTNPITLENDGVITLGPDDEIDLTDDLIIRVADNDTVLLYYIAKIIEMPICPECPTCPELNETVCPPCPPCNPEIVEVVNETIVYVEVPADPVDPVDDNTLPGFEAIFALAGLLGITYLIVRQKE